MPKLPDSWGNLRLGFDLLFWDNLVSTWDILQLILTNFRGDSQVQPSYSTAYLFFLLNNAHCAFQELDHRRLVLFRMLPQVLHVRWARKSELKVVNIKKISDGSLCCRKSGSLLSAPLKHFTFQVLLRKIVVGVGVEEEFLHLLVQLEVVPAEVARPNTLTRACSMQLQWWMMQNTWMTLSSSCLPCIRRMRFGQPGQQKRIHSHFHTSSFYFIQAHSLSYKLILFHTSSFAFIHYKLMSITQCSIVHVSYKLIWVHTGPFAFMRVYSLSLKLGHYHFKVWSLCWDGQNVDSFCFKDDKTYSNYSIPLSISSL